MKEALERILVTEEQIQTRLGEVAEELNRDYEGKFPMTVGILKGSVIFFADLVRRMKMPVEFDFMVVSSYGSGTVSSGELRIKKDLSHDVCGRDILIVEDIVDSGFTLTKLTALLRERGAASVKIVTLLDKKERRKYPISPDYCCFDIEDEFVVGYGLDYAEKFRQLPYIGILKREYYES